jgi:hypothetical protein
MIINYIYDFLKNYRNESYRQKEFIDIGINIILNIISILSACLSWSNTKGNILYKLFFACIAYLLNIFYLLYYYFFNIKKNIEI